MDLPMQRVTTQVSNPKSSIAWTTTLKKNPETRGAAPSLLRIHVIFLQSALTQDKLFNTAVQSLSAAKITYLRYLK